MTELYDTLKHCRGWRGAVARQLKKELRKMLDEHFASAARARARRSQTGRALGR